MMPQKLFTEPNPSVICLRYYDRTFVHEIENKWKEL